MLVRRTSARVSRHGFTLIEAMVALTITTLSASVLLLAVESTISTSDDAVESTIAAGMADQLVDEVLNKRYMSAGGDPEQWPMCPNAAEIAGAGRSLYDDSDDYVGMTLAPPRDPYNKLVGEGNDEGGLRHANFKLPSSVLSRWRQKIDVYYVSPTNLNQKLSSGSVSQFRAVEVTIERLDGSTWKTLATRRRVYAYFPPPS